MYEYELADRDGGPEQAARYWYYKLKACGDRLPPGDTWSRLREHLAARHQLTREQVEAMSFEQIAGILRRDYEATRPSIVWSRIITAPKGDPDRWIEGEVEHVAGRETDTRPTPPGPLDLAVLPSLLSASDLARLFGVRANRMEVYLRRLRARLPWCFEETEYRQRNKPTYLYKVADVTPYLKDHFRLL
jgi:hypothetical protein